MFPLVAALGIDDFLSGLILGCLLGVFLAPRIWSWLAWREWKDASDQVTRETRLADQVIERMRREVYQPDGPDGHRA